MSFSKTLRHSLLSLLSPQLANSLRAIRHNIQAVAEFHTDAWRYMSDCSPPDSRALGRPRSDRHLECQITKDYHRIEKGLALDAPKPQFGTDVMHRIVGLLPAAEKSAPTAEFVRHAKTAVQALESWNKAQEIDEAVSPLVTERHKADLVQLRKLYSSRRSVRVFDPVRTIPDQTFEHAVELALSTPSVCNRQPWAAHVYGGEDAQSILALQNGNRGFAESVPHVAVLTVDRRLFAGHHERNQRWIDGGLFAMNFVMALHGLGVDTCMLNWSMSNAESDTLRNTAAIAGSEDVIVLVAMGFAPDKYRVARSPRRKVGDVLRIHE